MPSINRSLFVAVQAAALCAFLIASPAPVAAMASPMPMPLPLASSDMNTLYHKPAVKDITHKSTRVKHTAPIASVARRNLAVIIAKRASIAASKSRRAASGSDTDDADYTKMQGLYNQASTHAQNLKSLAAQSSSVPDSSTGNFHQQAAAELTGFHSNVLGLQDILSQLGADKGLANYDRTDDLETLLKNTVNLNKNALSSVDTIVYNLPIVGKTLGPIVYDIKCVVDDVLNFVENTADGLLNGLQPLLQPLLGGLLSTACNTGVAAPSCSD
ncbi:hypothetical protein FIBSPDRAFT_849827 [Athelia psychrophila]|uniref:Uncharacterized protein n=1 Tax=Athelia psychrophila TaxID=1759441 RepID=A0A166U5E3_9AGAM|nr:hypothetical protein FIBSPDRAFT_849827 [Fibularhizoctonia sp. CBS 109695]